MTLQELQIAFLQELKEYLDIEHEKDSMKIPQYLKEASEKVITYQTNELAIPVQNICITFLNTSYYMKKPVLRIFFYAPGMLWKTSMMYQDFDADWLTEPLKKYEEELRTWAQQEKKSTEWIELEKRHMLRLLLKLASYYVKYDIMDYEVRKILLGMFKSDEFMISFGEYMDWQLPVYMEREIVDIFQMDEKVSLRFRSFKDLVYRKRTFENLDLCGARFTGCQFDKCLLKSSIWNDVLFENCVFKEVIIEGGEMLGTQFVNCKIQGLVKNNVKEQQGEEDQITGFFRSTEWIDCEVDNDGDL